MAEIAVITGCATGIGRALALDLHSRTLSDGGAAFKVYATDYRLEAVQDLGKQGLQVAQLDVTDTDSISAAIGHVVDTEGRIDLLVCNAGLGCPGWLSEIDYDQVENAFNVNVHGVFRCVQKAMHVPIESLQIIFTLVEQDLCSQEAVTPGMTQRQKGKIAVMASVNSYLVYPFNGAYSATKAAVLNMTEILAQEVYPFGIQVATVIPGWVKTDIVKTQLDRFDRYERPESFFQHTVEAVKKRRKAGIAKGVTPQTAAEDIGDGLSKAKMPRFIYTGTVLYKALFWGFVQQWIRPQFFADVLVKEVNLPESAKLGPHEYKGQYQEKSKATVKAPEE